MMTQIGLIRHGSTAWNKEGRAQGHTNNALDAEGLRQAQAVANRLSHERWTVIYASDLLRARQTAEIISEKLGIKTVAFDNRLREVYGGQIEGTTMDERIHKWGANWRDLDLGIESAEDAMIRGSLCIEEIAARHPNEHILIVSHGAIIRHSLNKLIAQFDRKELLKNTSVTRIIKTNDAWSCELFNCVNHLPE
jgi:probable phosphoglycerate mutase